MSRSFKPVTLGGQSSRYQLTTDRRRQRRQSAMANRRTIVVQPSEIKAMDVPFSHQITDALNNNTNIHLLNGIVVGTDSSRRIGKKIKMKAVRIRGELQLMYGPTGTPFQMSPQIVRMSLIYDKQPNGNIPIWNEIFNEYQTDGLAQASFYSGRNHFNQHRFQVLREEFIELNPGMLVTYQDSDQFEPYYKKFVDLYVKIGRETMYTGTGGESISNITTGSLLLAIRSNYAVPHTMTKATFSTRLTYYDD